MLGLRDVLFKKNYYILSLPEKGDPVHSLTCEPNPTYIMTLEEKIL